MDARTLDPRNLERTDANAQLVRAAAACLQERLQGVNVAAMTQAQQAEVQAATGRLRRFNDWLQSAQAPGGAGGGGGGAPHRDGNVGDGHKNDDGKPPAKKEDVTIPYTLTRPRRQPTSEDRRLFPELPSTMRARYERERPAHAEDMGTVVVCGREVSAAQKLLGETVMADDPAACRRAGASGADLEGKVYYNDGSMGGSYTAVYLGARPNKLRVLRFLVAAARADPNADVGRSCWGSSSGRATPCAAACLNHHFDAVRILVALGAQPDHYTYDCKCPRDIPQR